MKSTEKREYRFSSAEGASEGGRLSIYADAAKLLVTNKMTVLNPSIFNELINQIHFAPVLEHELQLKRLQAMNNDRDVLSLRQEK